MKIVVEEEGNWYKIFLEGKNYQFRIKETGKIYIRIFSCIFVFSVLLLFILVLNEIFIFNFSNPFNIRAIVFYFIFLGIITITFIIGELATEGTWPINYLLGFLGIVIIFFLGNLIITGEYCFCLNEFFNYNFVANVDSIILLILIEIVLNLFIFLRLTPPETIYVDSNTRLVKRGLKGKIIKVQSLSLYRAFDSRTIGNSSSALWQIGVFGTYYKISWNLIANGNYPIISRDTESRFSRVILGESMRNYQIIREMSLIIADLLNISLIDNSNEHNLVIVPNKVRSSIIPKMDSNISSSDENLPFYMNNENNLLNPTNFLDGKDFSIRIEKSLNDMRQISGSFFNFNSRYLFFYFVLILLPLILFFNVNSNLIIIYFLIGTGIYINTIYQKVLIKITPKKISLYKKGLLQPDNVSRIAEISLKDLIDFSSIKVLWYGPDKCKREWYFLELREINNRTFLSTRFNQKQGEIIRKMVNSSLTQLISSPSKSFSNQ